MADVAVTILGLGRAGASVALALKRYNQQNSEHRFIVTGYDTNPDSARHIHKIKAVEEVKNRPEAAVKDADIIVMAMPQAEVLAAYELIKQAMRSGAVIIDLSTLKAVSLEWGDKNLPEGVHMVCATPVINPKYLFEGVDETTRATEDYFDKGVMMLMPSVKCIKEAISLVSDFTVILGSSAYFLDATEHDALMVWTNVLPSVLGVAYFYKLMKSSGWEDAQRLTNPAMAMLTHHLLDTHPDDLNQTWVDSGDSLLRALDDMILTLREVRTALASKDRDALASTLEQSSEQYEKWINRRHNNRWQIDEALATDSPSFGDVMGNMFGGFLTNRIGRGKKD